ncbi:hypothetical protein ABEW05_002450 [Botrytis cinerea]
MTDRQGPPRPPTSTFIELRPRIRHTISVPPLSLASTVSDSSKAIGAPIVKPIDTPLSPHYAQTSHPKTHPTPPRPATPAQLTPTVTALSTIQKSSDPLLEKLDEDKGLGGNSNLNLNGNKDVVVGLDGEERGEMEDTGPSPPSSSSRVSPTNMTKKSSKSSKMNEMKIRKIIRDSSTPQEEVALLSDAAKMGVSEDGNPDDSAHSHSDTEPAHFGQTDPSTSSSSISSPPSDIYVSICDPAGRAFVPGKIKPLPKWMSLLPNNVHREREGAEGDACQKKSQAAVSRAKLPEAYADGASSSHSEDCPGDHDPFTSCPTQESVTEVSPREHSEQVTPKDRLSIRECVGSTSESTSNSTRRPSASTLSSLALPSPEQQSPKTTRPRSVSIEEKLPRPHQHPASAYRRANRSSTIESACIKPNGLVQPIQYPEHIPRDVSERPLTPYPKNDSPDPFQTQLIPSSSSPFPSHPNSKPTLLHSPLSNFITPRKGSCCELSTSLESASVGEIKKRGRRESGFDSMFESFPRPEIGKNNSNYASSLCRSPKLGFLEKGNEYLEYVSGVILPGGGKEGDVGKEGIVEKIRRQRVGTVSLGQVAQNVKEEKERKRAETNIQTEWNWLDNESSKNHIANAIVEQEANAHVGSSRSGARRNRGVSDDEVGRLPRDGSRMSGRRRRGTSGEERGQGSRMGSRVGSRKEREREREREREKIERDKLEKVDKGKGKEELVEEGESGTRVEVGVAGVDESREQLKKELKGLFGEE